MVHAISSFSKRLFIRRENLPEALTSYDLLKTLALLLMFVDHAGHFFYPEEEWFRVIGRLSVPIWFFLIGFADTRRVQSAIWVGGLLVMLSTIVSGYYILPLNILFSLALARLCVDRLMVGALQSYESFAGMFFLLFFATFPSVMLFEYGAMGVMFTVFGYLRRHKEGLTIKPLALYGFLTAIALFYVVFSGVAIPQLSAEQMYVLTGGMAGLMVILFFFRGCVFSNIPKRFNWFFWPIKIMGRHTLLIYVMHLVALNLIMLGVGDDRYGFGQVQILAPSFMQIIRAVIG